MLGLRKKEVAFDTPVRVKDMSLKELMAYHNELSTELFFSRRGLDRKALKAIEDEYEEALMELYRRRNKPTQH